MRFFQTLCVALVLSGALAAQTSGPSQGIPKLKVLSTDIESRHVVVELQNQSDKTVTAYMLETKAFDASGKLLTDTNLGYNNLFFDPAGAPDDREANLIAPGQTATRKLDIGPEAASAQVTVVAVVYDDRTYEGAWHEVFPLFDVRAREAASLRKAAALMQTYPASPEGFRSTVQAARALAPGQVNNVLYEKLHVPLEAAVDREHALPNTVPMPDREQWQAAVKRLSDEAAFWAAQSEAKR